MAVQTGSVPFRSASDGPRVTLNGGTTMAGKPFPGAAAPFKRKGASSAPEGSPEEEADESPEEEDAEGPDDDSDDSSDSGPKSYSPAERKAMARIGHAMPDGSFPIKNKGDVRNAVAAHKLASDDKSQAAAKHIIKRARQLGAEPMLNDTIHAAAKGN